MAVEFILGKEKVSVDCYRNLNLLAHAQMEELDIGSQCGGHGICGGDRVKIQEGGNKLTPLTENEKEHLTPEEISEGWRLACQCWPQSDGDSVLIATE